MIKRTVFIEQERMGLLEDGEIVSDTMLSSIDNEYYNMLCEHIKKGNTITSEIYDDLSDGQKYHFNKHYNHRGDKVVEQTNTIETIEESPADPTYYIAFNRSFDSYNDAEKHCLSCDFDPSYIETVDPSTVSQPTTQPTTQNKRTNKRIQITNVRNVKATKDYFIYVRGEGYRKIENGKEIEILDGIQTFIYKNNENNYSISEVKTGMHIASAKRKNETIQEAQNKMTQYQSKVKELIELHVKKFGLSPASASI